MPVGGVERRYPLKGQISTTIIAVSHQHPSRIFFCLPAVFSGHRLALSLLQPSDPVWTLDRLLWTFLLPASDSKPGSAFGNPSAAYFIARVPGLVVFHLRRASGPFTYPLPTSNPHLCPRLPRPELGRRRSRVILAWSRPTRARPMRRCVISGFKKKAD